MPPSSVFIIGGLYHLGSSLVIAEGPGAARRLWGIAERMTDIMEVGNPVADPKDAADDDDGEEMVLCVP